MAIGSAIIMLSGWAWFSVVMHTSPMLTLYATVIKFIPGDIIKISLAAAVLPSGWKLLASSRGSSPTVRRTHSQTTTRLLAPKPVTHVAGYFLLAATQRRYRVLRVSPPRSDLRYQFRIFCSSGEYLLNIGSMITGEINTTKTMIGRQTSHP